MLKNKTSEVSTIKNNLNYSFNDTYYTALRDSSYQYTVLKWKDYTSSWEDFTSKYPTFDFINDSKILISNLNTEKNELQKFDKPINTNLILENSSGDNNQVVVVNCDAGNVDLNIWHNDENIYFCWYFARDMYTHAEVTINLNQVEFYKN